MVEVYLISALLNNDFTKSGRFLLLEIQFELIINEVWRHLFHFSILTMTTFDMKREVILWLFLSCPILAFAYCLTLAYLSDHRTETHCGDDVPQFAMSVSEATAVPTSSHYFWTGTILLHIYPRIYESRLIFNRFYDILLSSTTITFGFWYACIYIQW